MKTQYIVTGLVVLAGGAFLYSKAKDASSGDAAGGSSWGYPYFQSAALPSTVSYDPLTGEVVSGGGSTQAPDSSALTSLSTITQEQLSAMTRANEAGVGQSLLAEILGITLQSGSTNVSASYDVTEGKASVSASQKAAIPAMPDPIPIYKTVPNYKNYAKSGVNMQISGYSQQLTGYKTPIYNDTLNIWEFPA